MNLDIVYGVWNDLEGFYEKGDFPSWEDMMQKVCLVKDGKPRLQSLLAALRAEGYAAAESLDQLQELSNIFQFVTDNFTEVLVRENWSKELCEGSKNYLEVVDQMMFSPQLLENNRVLEGKKEFIVGLEEYFANPYALDYLSAEDGEMHYRELFVDDSFFEYTYSPQDAKTEVCMSMLTDAELNALRAGHERKENVSLFVIKCLLRGKMAKEAAKFSRVIVFPARQLVKEGSNQFGRETLQFESETVLDFRVLRGVKQDALGNKALLLGVM